MNISSLSNLDSFQLLFNGLPTPGRQITWPDLKTWLTNELFTQPLTLTGVLSIIGATTITGNLVVSGDVKATTYHVGTDAGIDFSGAVTTITVKKGIITAAA